MLPELPREVLGKIFWLRKRDDAALVIQNAFRRFQANETRIVRMLLTELRDVARNAFYNEIIATYRVGALSPRITDSVTIFTTDDPIDDMAVGDAEIVTESEGGSAPARFIGQLWCDENAAIIEIVRVGRHAGTRAAGATVVCNQTYTRRIRNGRVTLRHRKRRMGPEMLNIPFF